MRPFSFVSCMKTQLGLSKYSKALTRLCHLPLSPLMLLANIVKLLPLLLDLFKPLPRLDFFVFSDVFELLPRHLTGTKVSVPSKGSFGGNWGYSTGSCCSLKDFLNCYRLFHIIGFPDPPPPGPPPTLPPFKIEQNSNT